MRSIDNLPTGGIVFFGTDYNLYKFDGSNLINLSDRPITRSPYVKLLIDSIMNGISPQFLGTNSFWVRVNPMTHSIYLTIGGVITYNSASGNKICLAYDYLNDYWYLPDYIFGDYCYVPSIGVLAGVLTREYAQNFVVLDNVASFCDNDERLSFSRIFSRHLRDLRFLGPRQFQSLLLLNLGTQSRAASLRLSQ